MLTKESFQYKFFLSSIFFPLSFFLSLFFISLWRLLEVNPLLPEEDYPGDNPEECIPGTLNSKSVYQEKHLRSLRMWERQGRCWHAC